MMKTDLFRTFQNDTKKFLRCRYISLASNSWRNCTELVTVEFSINFKLCLYRVNARSNFATVTFSLFSNVTVSCERSLRSVKMMQMCIVLAVCKFHQRVSSRLKIGICNELNNLKIPPFKSIIHRTKYDK